jgi:hypothetical protein
MDGSRVHLAQGDIARRFGLLQCAGQRSHQRCPRIQGDVGGQSHVDIEQLPQYAQ